MILALNAVLLFLILLIAYWWANQGLFSAILHLACVIVAGAVALAFWEPLTVHLLLRGNRFDNYAWGVALIGLFTFSLLVLRVIADRIIPANVNLPQWANLLFGLPIGGAAGVLTVGLLMIGAGFIQSHHEIVGYRGYGRSPRTAEVGQLEGSLWLPAHRVTARFYEMLSVGSMYPTFQDTPLRERNPHLHMQASLVRDSYNDGRGQLALLPDAARITDVLRDEQTNRYRVTVDFQPLSRDFGEQLTLSASQIRLICRASGSAAPTVVFPDAWMQETSGGPMTRFLFDDASHYITTVPGRESATVHIEFPVPQGRQPRFIQIRGTRYRLPPAQAAPPGQIAAGVPGPANAAPPGIPAGAGSIDPHIEVNHSIRPVWASVNQPLGTLKHVDRHLTEGAHTFTRGAARAAQRLRIQGIHEPPGTRVVQLDVSRGLPSDIFGAVRQQVGDDARLALVDAQGNTYSPIGYIHEHRDGVTISLDPARTMARADTLPVLPTAGTDRLRLIFRVTARSTIVAFRYGEVTVGQCNLEVPARQERGR